MLNVNQLVCEYVLVIVLLLQFSLVLYKLNNRNRTNSTNEPSLQIELRTTKER